MKEELIVTDSQFTAPCPETAAVLITGGAQRIGAAVTEFLASSGWPVVIHYNASQDAAVALRDRIRRCKGAAEIIQGDLSQPAELRKLIAHATELAGPIGVLINNASVYEWDDATHLNEQSWALHMDTNLLAPVLLSQAFVERLPAQLGGVIINVLDSRVLNPMPRHMSYTLSKAGLWTFTQTLAQDLAPRVRVNGIGPGPTLPVKGQTMEDFRQRCERLPLKHPASMDEICQAIRFLINARSVTGQMIALDGGDHLVGNRDFA